MVWGSNLFQCNLLGVNTSHMKVAGVDFALQLGNSHLGCVHIHLVELVGESELLLEGSNQVLSFLEVVVSGLHPNGVTECVR